MLQLFCINLSEDSFLSSTSSSVMHSFQVNLCVLPIIVTMNYEISLFELILKIYDQVSIILSILLFSKPFRDEVSIPYVVQCSTCVCRSSS